jgi:integrase
MATYRKRGSKWRAEVFKGGRRESRSFPTKARAVAWATMRETDLVEARLPDKRLAEALRRFASEVSPARKGERWEVARLGLLERDRIASVRLSELSASVLADWRDRRLQAVSGASVRREMNLLRAVLRVARKEWGWLRGDPLADVDKPMAPPPRRRRIAQDEVERIALALGYDGGEPETAQHRIALAFLFALETAMRSGEILALTWADVGAKSVTLQATKNGDVRRVPLSPAARDILALLPRDRPTVFDVAGAVKDALFRRAVRRAGVPNLTFHDSRAEAIWRLSKKLDVLDLARVIGHRDIRSLMHYYNADADELADRL